MPQVVRALNRHFQRKERKSGHQAGDPTPSVRHVRSVGAPILEKVGLKVANEGATFVKACLKDAHEAADLGM